MSKLLKQISESILKYDMLTPDEPVLAAVSGGADSVCLLLALKDLGCQVSAVHVEHGIRGQESQRDCAFVKDLCMREDIDLTVRHIDAPALALQNKRSLEEAARDERYRILEETAVNRGIRVIATAHHRGDRVETVLWNLIRGSSLAGLCGILPVREMGSRNLKLIRPLLECGRDEIEGWLRKRGQNWRIDSTNLDRTITRNAVRLEILPAMVNLNAGTERHIAQSAEDLAKIAEYLDEITEQAYRDTVLNKGSDPLFKFIDLNALEALPELIRSRVLHRAIGEAEGGFRDITREHVESLMRLSRMDNGKQISLPGGLRAVREEGCIVLETDRGRFSAPGECGKTLPESSVQERCREIRIDRDGVYPFSSECTVTARFGIWDGGEPSKKKYTKTLAYDTIIPYITLRTRQEGDWIVVNSAGGRKKLKDYLIDEKVPRDQRDRIPLIAQGSHVLWVIGHRISEAARVTEGAHFAEITAEFGTKSREATGEKNERDNEGSDTGRQD